MKLKAWQLSALASLTALSVLAQAPNSAPPVPEAPTPPPAAPAESTVSPETPAKPEKEAKPKAKKARAKKAKAAEAKPAKAPETKNSTFVLNPPVTASVKCEALDVRGQGSFNGEVITHLKKGEPVTVLEEITLGHIRSGEPAQWSKIVMPASATVWVDASFIDDASKTVRVKKVNVRGGPGENYSIVARLDKGAVVKQIGRKEGWLEIEPPTNAVGFVASEYLETPGTEVATVPSPVPAPPAETTVVVNTPPPAPAPVRPAATGPIAPAPTPASQSEQETAALHRATAPEPLVAAPAPAPVASPSAETAGAPETPRIVTREGFVHRSLNPIVPADYELRDIKTGDLTEYVQPAPHQKFKIYVGTRVRIVGTESLDVRWPRTPVLQVQSVDLMP